MKKKRKSLAELLFEDDRLIKEEDEDEGGDDIFGDDSGDDDDGGDDDGGDDSGDDEEGGDDEGGDEEESDDDGGDDSDDSDDDKEEDKPAGPSDDTIDGEVNNLLTDFEAEAVASAEKDAALKGESFIHKKPIANLLFEADDVAFDVGHFAGNIARVIDNYQTLLDVEKMIFDKAMAFITAKYGEPTADEFESILADQHQISFVTGAGSDASEQSEEIVPVAAGAMTPAQRLDLHVKIN